MNWRALGSFFGGLISSIGQWITGPKAPPEPPAPAPEKPGYSSIDKRIDEALAHIEAEDAAHAASEPPTILPPRLDDDPDAEFAKRRGQ